MKLLRNALILLVPALGVIQLQASQVDQAQEQVNKEKVPYNGYEKDKLVATRIAWVGQESRIGQLKFEAEKIAKNHVVEYISGNNIATIDANKNTITTCFEDEKVTLSYEDFYNLLRDKEIIDLANKRLSEEAQSKK